jgi:hypothetical protein
MTEEKEKQLFEKYPKIFRQKDLPMNQTCMCWGVSCADGWYDLIDNLCYAIQNHIDYKKLPQVEATQVKEKYGGLRFYVNHSDEYVSGLISMAESMSYKICEYCGNKGKSNSRGWITTLCEPCRTTYNKQMGITELDDAESEET